MIRNVRDVRKTPLLLSREGESLGEIRYFSVADSMSIDLYNENFLSQKLNYIDNNPCQPKRELVPHPYDYLYGLLNIIPTEMILFNC